MLSATSDELFLLLDFSWWKHETDTEMFSDLHICIMAYTYVLTNTCTGFKLRFWKISISYMEMNRLKRGGRGWRESLKHSLEYSCLHLCIQYPVQMFLCFVNLDICPFFYWCSQIGQNLPFLLWLLQMKDYCNWWDFICSVLCVSRTSLVLHRI